MKNSDNIEKLFKETFEHFEADVNPKIWTNVQSGIKSVSGGTASVAGKMAIGKIAAIGASVILAAGSIWYYSSLSEKTSASSETQHSSETIAKEEITQNTISEQPSSEKTSNKNKTSPSVQKINQNSPDNSEQTQLVSESNETANSAAVPISNNNTTASSQPAAKYGNAPAGDGGMIRGNQNTYSASGSANLTAVDDQEEEASTPTATIFVNTTSGDVPLTVNFINQGVASSLSWDFGDGSISRESAPSHTFDKPGNYTVKLTAKNPSGITSDKITIEVRAVSSIINIPNIFTPNGDGENDYFFFEMKNIVTVGVAIYSQKEGKQIYTWNSIDGKWDGKLLNGEDAPEGVYLYSIQANGADGIIHSKKGFVTLSIKH